MAIHHLKMVPLNWCFSCIFRKICQCSMRLPNSRFCGYDTTSGFHSHGSILTPLQHEMVSWSDNILCRIPCLWMRYSISHWIVMLRFWNKESQISMKDRDIACEEKLLTLPQQKGPDIADLLPSGHLLSLKYIHISMADSGVCCWQSGSAWATEAN